MCEVCIGKISNLQYVTVLTAGVKQWLRSIQKTQKANKKLHVLFSQYGPARTCSIAETNIKKVQDLDNLYVYYNAVLYVPFWIALHVRAFKNCPHFPCCNSRDNKYICTLACSNNWRKCWRYIVTALSQVNMISVTSDVDKCWLVHCNLQYGRNSRYTAGWWWQWANLQ